MHFNSAGCKAIIKIENLEPSYTTSFWPDLQTGLVAYIYTESKLISTLVIFLGDQSVKQKVSLIQGVDEFRKN